MNFISSHQSLHSKELDRLVTLHYFGIDHESKNQTKKRIRVKITNQVSWKWVWEKKGIDKKTSFEGHESEF